MIKQIVMRLDPGLGTHEDSRLINSINAQAQQTTHKIWEACNLGHGELWMAIMRLMIASFKETLTHSDIAQAFPMLQEASESPEHGVAF